MEAKSQTQPSENCWAAKIRGTPASIKCDGALVFLRDANPIRESSEADPKLAVAEKHMVLEEEMRSGGSHWGAAGSRTRKTESD